MKAILVPIDKEAEDRIKNGDESESDVIIIFFNDDDYYELWKTPFYFEINKKIQAGIDDGESAVVSGKEDLTALYSIIDEYEKKIYNSIVYSLKSLTVAAIRFDTSVQFYY